MNTNTSIRGNTLLHVTVSSPHKMNLLLEQTHLDINAKNGNGLTALHLAVQMNNLASVESLLRYPGIDVNLKTSYNLSTSLHLAAKCASSHVIQSLLRVNGLELNVKNNRGESAIFHASSSEIFKLLLPHVDVNVQDLFGRTILHWVIIKGIGKNFDSLLEHPNIDVNVQDENGRTPLHFAVNNHSRSIAKRMTLALLECPGINVHIKSDEGQSALAALHENLERLEIQLDTSRFLKLSIIILNNDFLSQFVLDEIETDATMIRSLLRGLVRNFVSEYEIASALQIAANAKAASMVNELLFCFSHFNIHRAFNILKNPMIEAAFPHLDVNRQNFRGDTILHKARSVDIVEKILGCKDIKVNVINNEGFSPLHVAILRNNFEIVEVLLKHCDVNARDGRGKTALHIAALWGNPKILNLILQCDVDVNAQDHMGNTALHSTGGNQEIIDMLLRDPNIHSHVRNIFGKVYTEWQDNVLNSLYNF